MARQSGHAVVGRCRRNVRNRDRPSKEEKKGTLKVREGSSPSDGGREEGVRQRRKSRERERDLESRREIERERRHGGCVCTGTRCIGLASREWRWRREKEEKDRVVKLVCRSVTA